MKLVSHINELLKKNINKNKNIVLFGQNINAGSCLSGLTKGLDVKKKNIIISNCTLKIFQWCTVIETMHILPFC